MAERQESAIPIPAAESVVEKPIEVDPDEAILEDIKRSLEEKTDEAEKAGWQKVLMYVLIGLATLFVARMVMIQLAKFVFAQFGKA